MVIHCLAYVGKLNEPLFVHMDPSSITIDAATSSISASVYLESIVHASLDVIEERIARRTQSRGNSGNAVEEMFLGQLFVVEDYRVFAWCSNTQIKTIIVCDIATVEGSVKDILQQFYHAYVQSIQNLFQSAGKPIVLNCSQKLKNHVQQQIRSFNELNP